MESKKYELFSESMHSLQKNSLFIKKLFPINTEEKYNDVLSIIDLLVDTNSDDVITTCLINKLTQEIESYEDHNINEIKIFVEKCTSKNNDITIIRTLMDQNNLSFSELPEIGDKAAVSKVLSGKKNLNRRHIEKICNRFSIPHSMFFMNNN